MGLFHPPIQLVCCPEQIGLRDVTVHVVFVCVCVCVSGSLNGSVVLGPYLYDLTPILSHDQTDEKSKRAANSRCAEDVVRGYKNEFVQLTGL